MPNGHSDSSEAYNKGWCDERHQNLQADIREIRDDLRDMKRSLMVIARKLDSGKPDVAKAEASFWTRAKSLLPWIVAAVGIGAGIGHAIRPAAPAAQVEAE